MKKIIIAIALIMSMFLSSYTNVYATEIEEPIEQQETQENEPIISEEEQTIILLLEALIAIEIVAIIIK